MRIFFLATVLLLSVIGAKLSFADQAALSLGLVAPVQIELSHMYSDGGTLGGSLIDANGKSLKFCYDGQQTFKQSLPLHKYHVFINAHHPSHYGAIELPACSTKERAIYSLVFEWISKEYPEDWRDSQQYANTGYILRFINDMEARSCNQK